MSIILESHRGLASNYPENTMVAMRAAVSLGYGMIELDTKFTLDNRCVILHDRTLNRTARRTDGSTLPENTLCADSTYDELRTLDFGLWFDKKFAGEPIPTLEDVLALTKESGVPLKFDNVMWSHTPQQRAMMFDTIEKMNVLPNVGFTCGNLNCIRELLVRFPSAYVHYDGIPDTETLAALSQLLPRERLTVWLRYHNEHTSWCQTPPVSAELAATVAPVATIGLWLLTKSEELADAEKLNVQFVETDGSLRP